MDKFSFKDLAAKAQQAGTKLAAQVKEQQQKYAQRAQEGTVATTDFRPPDEFLSETENALRLVQIQNKALRDRLRAAADENERLKDQVHQLSSSTTSRANGQALISNQAEDVHAGANSVHPRMAAVAAENEQLREVIRELKDLVRRAEEHAEIADATADQKVKSLEAELMKEREEKAAALKRATAAAAAAAASEQHLSTSSSSPHEAELISVQQQLETMREDMAVAIAAREAAESASQQAQEEIHNLTATISSLKTAQSSNEEAASRAAIETTAAVQALEDLRTENTRLRTDIEALQQRFVTEQGEKEEKESQQKQEIENLKSRLEEAMALKEAAIEAAAAMEQAVSATQASTPASEAYQRRIEELEAEVEIAKQTNVTAAAAAVDYQLVQKQTALEKAEECHAAAVSELKLELEKQHKVEIDALQEELTQTKIALEEQQKTAAAQATAAAAAASATASAAYEELERKITEMEDILREKDAQIESLQQELAAAQSGRIAALEELRTELEAQHAQHASQVDSLQDQLTRLRSEHADEVDALREENASLETKLNEAQTAAAAATEASVEEAGWLREGAEELQRQLDASRVESEAALHAVQEEVTTLKEQLAAAEAEATSTATALAAAVQTAEKTAAITSTAEKEAYEDKLAAVQTEVDSMRIALETAHQEVASLKTGATGAAEEKTALAQRITELEGEKEQTNDALLEAHAKVAQAEAAAAEAAAQKEPPPPSYDALQMQHQLDALRAETALALQEAATAAERALVSEAARQEASEQLVTVRSAAEDESIRLRADVEAAHQRVAELEASLAIAAATAATATTAAQVANQQRQNQPPLQPASDEKQSVIERLGSGISASTLSPPLSPGSTTNTRAGTSATGISGLGTAPMVPHHRRDPSYSSEIEPREGEDEEDGNTIAIARVVSPKETTPTPSGALPPLPPSVPLAPRAPPPSLLLHPGSSLEEQIRVLEAELNDSERTHALRDTATAVLKEEIGDLRRQQKRAQVDVDYLKAVLVESFASGELNSKSHMLPVLARLLQFSPKDMERALAGKTGAASGGAGGGAGGSAGGASEALSAASAAASALFNRWSATAPASSGT